MITFPSFREFVPRIEKIPFFSRKWVRPWMHRPHTCQENKWIVLVWLSRSPVRLNIYLVVQVTHSLHLFSWQVWGLCVILYIAKTKTEMLSSWRTQMATSDENFVKMTTFPTQWKCEAPTQNQEHCSWFYQGTPVLRLRGRIHCRLFHSLLSQPWRDSYFHHATTVKQFRFVVVVWNQHTVWLFIMASFSGVPRFRVWYSVPGASKSNVRDQSIREITYVTNK